jgi:sensor c-di-GMP phosphodiesterase-like protein
MFYLASKLGVEIVAKSVETREQQAFLRSAVEGANAQGFYYSKPLTAEQATDYLRVNQSQPTADTEAVQLLLPGVPKH